MAHNSFECPECRTAMKDILITAWVVTLLAATVASVITFYLKPEPQLVSTFVCARVERGHCVEYKEYLK